MVGKSSTVFMIISLETCFLGKRILCRIFMLNFGAAMTQVIYQLKVVRNSTFTVFYICGKSIANASKQYKEIDHECHGSKSVYSHRFVLFLN